MRDIIVGTDTDGNGDVVNHPSHYKSESGLEAIDVIDAFVPNLYAYYLGNVLKYLLRAHKKGDTLTNLRKAKWYLDRLIEKVGGKEIVPPGTSE